MWHYALANNDLLFEKVFEKRSSKERKRSSKMNRDVADIRNPTCFKSRILFPIRFAKDQGFPRHDTLCITPVGVLCTRLQSPMFFSALPYRICRINEGGVRDVIN